MLNPTPQKVKSVSVIITARLRPMSEKQPGSTFEKPPRRGKHKRRGREQIRPGVATTSRRNFLKALTPLGWLPEVARKKGFSGLSREAQVSIAKDVALLLGPATIAKLTETRESTLKEKVLSFTWEDASHKEKLNLFIENLATAYIKSSKTPRLTKEELLAKTATYNSTEDYIQAVRKVNPQYAPTSTQWGYADYTTDKVFIDREGLKRQAPGNAGLSLITTLWHEWGHLDVVERTTGELLNNPDAFFYSPNSLSNEQFRRYRGGEIYTDTYFGYRRFDEVWLESITTRRIIETLGLTEKEKLTSAADYYENGVDFFAKFTSVVGIPLQMLYEMHAASDFEGFAKLVGQHLPKARPPLEKGIELFTSIHRADSNMIQETGVFEVVNIK